MMAEATTTLTKFDISNSINSPISSSKSLIGYEYHNSIFGDLLKQGLIILALAAVVLATASAQMNATMPGNEMYTVNISSSAALGMHLVNETGFTLYYFMNDAQGKGTSACNDQCAGIWPPFYAEKIVVPAGLNASDFTSMMRTDGKEQTAYKGWPLYYYSMDMKSGDALGQGKNNVWFVVKP